jgi:flagellar protein FlbD
MIRVTELHGKGRYINADMIEFIESNPETQLVMNNGRRVFVQETPEQLVDLVIAYKQRCSQPGLAAADRPAGDALRKE